MAFIYREVITSFNYVSFSIAFTVLYDLFMKSREMYPRQLQEICCLSLILMTKNLICIFLQHTLYICDYKNSFIERPHRLVAMFVLNLKRLRVTLREK